MRFKDKDFTIILTEIVEVKEEIGEVKEYLLKICRNFTVCLFPIHEVAPMHPISNAIPPDSVLAMPVIWKFDTLSYSTTLMASYMQLTPLSIPKNNKKTNFRFLTLCFFLQQALQLVPMLNSFLQPTLQL